MKNIIVIGAGQAGQALCTELRDKGYDGALTLIGAEAALPYQRPPLSKAYLLGEMDKERLYLRPNTYYDDANITVRTNAQVDQIDPVAKTVIIGGETLPYDKLAITTGSTPRRLPAAVGGTLAGVFTVRDLADVDAMAPYFKAGKRCLIVGGGYIGLEAAAVAAKRGVSVTLVEMGDRILQRVAAPETSALFRDIHTAHGVDIKEGTGLRTLHGSDHVTGATLSDGREIDVDFVIAGIGITPNSELAQAAGLTIDNGIAVNAHSQTSDPDIYAAGDCASFPYKEGRLRLESVPNAIDQAQNAARNMLGHNEAYHPKIWFWSDQYDIKLQIAGLNSGYTQVATRRADGGAVSFWYFNADQLIAVDAANDPRAYMVAKRLIEAGKTVDPTTIEDPNTDLKALLRA